MHALVEGLADARALARFIPGFDLVIDDLSQLSDEALLSRPMEPLPLLTLWALRDSRSIDDLIAHLPAFAAKLEQLTLLLSYILRIGERFFHELQATIVAAAPSTEVPMASTAEQLIQQGIRRGHAEARAADVVGILETRGFAVTAEQRTRILSCDDETTLIAWHRAAVTCAEVDAIFTH